MKYKVIKEFAGIKEGEEIGVNRNRVKYMTEAGYIKPIEPEVKAAKPKRKKKIDKEAEARQDKSE